MTTHVFVKDKENIKCPLCQIQVEVAIGGESFPKHDDYFICSECGNIARYKVIDKHYQVVDEPQEELLKLRDTNPLKFFQMVLISTSYQKMRPNR